MKQQARNDRVPVVDTETLIDRIKEAEARQSRWGWEDRIGQGTTALFKYCREIWNFLGDWGVGELLTRGYVPDKMTLAWYKEQPRPKFSTKEIMLEILRGEHKVIKLLNHKQLNYKDIVLQRIVMPQHYDKLNKLLAATRWREPWPHAGVAKSLFIPRWVTTEELKEAVDFKKATEEGFQELEYLKKVSWKGELANSIPSYN